MTKTITLTLTLQHVQRRRGVKGTTLGSVVHLRLPPLDHEMIDKAAALCNMHTAEFIRQVATQVAEEVLNDDAELHPD